MRKKILRSQNSLHVSLKGGVKSSLRDYRIKNILDYEKKEKKKEKIVEVKTKGRADERKREREEGFVPWRRLVRESVACEDERQKGAREGSRRKDTSSLGAKKRNGHSPARWRKVGRSSQPLTGAKETTLRAIADSCPLGRASRERETGLLFPLSFFPAARSSPRHAAFYFILFTFRCPPPLAADRSRKITENDLSERKLFSLGLENTRRGIDSIKLGVTFSRGKR